MKNPSNDNRPWLYTITIWDTDKALRWRGVYRTEAECHEFRKTLAKGYEYSITPGYSVSPLGAHRPEPFDCKRYLKQQIDWWNGGDNVA